MQSMPLNTDTSRCSLYPSSRTKFRHTRRATSSTAESSTIERRTCRLRPREVLSALVPMPTAQLRASTAAMATAAATEPTVGDTSDPTIGGLLGRGIAEVARRVPRLRTTIWIGIAVLAIGVVPLEEAMSIHTSLVMVVMSVVAEMSALHGMSALRGTTDLREMTACPRGTTECLETTDFRRETIATGTTGDHRDRGMTAGTTAGRTAAAGHHRGTTGDASGSGSSATYIDDRKCRQVAFTRARWPSVSSMLDVFRTVPWTSSPDHDPSKGRPEKEGFKCGIDYTIGYMAQRGSVDFLFCFSKRDWNSDSPAAALSMYIKSGTQRWGWKSPERWLVFRSVEEPDFDNDTEKLIIKQGPTLHRHPLPRESSASATQRPASSSLGTKTRARATACPGR